MKTLPKNWQSKFYGLFALWMAIGTAFVAYRYSLDKIPYVLGGGFSLMLGFKITEYLIACLTGIKKANATAIVLLFVGKFAWWAGLFLFAKKLPAEGNIPVGIGLACFLCAVVSLVLFTIGPPKISSGEESV